MTYKEIKRRLVKCEKLLEKTKEQNLTNASPALRQQVQLELKQLHESISKYKSMLLNEEKTYILTPKSGKPSAASLGDDEVEALKDADDIQAIKSADGEEIKEQEGVEFSLEETKAIAKKVGKAVAMSLKAVGDSVTTMKAHRIEPNSFDVHVEYKNGRDDEFSFYITDDTLHLVDFSFDKELVDVGVKPSGEAIVHVDHLANELQKHFKSLSEDVNEGPHQTTYIKVARSDYKKAMAVLDQNLDPTYVKTDIVDDDGDGNVIIYFNFRAKDDGEPGEDVGAFIYDASMDLQSQGIPVVDASHDLDETKDINDPVLMKMRALKSKIGRKKGIVKGGERHTGRKRELLAKLKAKRAQVMSDMEQEAEPEGGPIADKYGDILNKIDAAIVKASGRKEMDYDTAVGKANEGWNDKDDLFAFGYNLDLIQAVIDHLKSNYSEDDYELHVGRGDTHPNAVTLKNPEMENDEELGNLLIAAEDEEETDYVKRRKEEDDYNEAQATSVQDVIDPADYGVIGQNYLAGFNKPHSLDADELEMLGRKIVKQLYKGDFKAAMARHGGTNVNETEVDTAGADLDVGHQDDEPSMLKASAFETAEYAAKLVKKLAQYDKHDGEVDFPNWWQKKLILARDYMSSAFHYLDSEEKQPAIDQLALEGKGVLKEWGSSDQNIFNQSIHKALGEPTSMPSPFSQELESAAEDAVDHYWDDWEEYDTDREGLIEHAKKAYLRAYFKETFNKMVQMFRESKGHPSKGHRGGAKKIHKAHSLVVAKMKELAKQYKAGDKSVVPQLKDLTAKKKALEISLDNAVAGTNKDQTLTELSGDQREAIMDLQNILDQASGLGDEAREIVRQSFPKMLSKADAYGAFEFGSSANRYDTTLESIIEEIEEYYDEEEDDMDEEYKGKHQGSNYKWPMSKATKDRKEADKKKTVKEEMDGGRLFDYFKSKGYNITERRPDGYPAKEGVEGYQVSRGSDRSPQSVIFQHNPSTDEFTISQMSGYRIDQKDAIKAGMKKQGQSYTAGQDYYMTDGNYNPVGISAEGLKDIVDHVMSGLDREAKAQGDFYKDRGHTSGTIDEGATCCGRCGRVHVKGSGCKRPYLKGKDHCRNK